MSTMKNEHDTQSLEDLYGATPARLNVARAGTRPRTREWLKFRHDHALAKDAVHSELSEEFLHSFCAGAQSLPIVQSNASDRADYILFPPKGKRISDEAIEALKSSCKTGCDVQIVIGDGLSSNAVEQNAPDVLAMLSDGLEIEKFSVGTPVVVRFARVAVGDQIAHALGARLVIMLIGERPGLTSSSSMSAYITFNPGPHTISSDRTVVSNIHAGGTPSIEAGAYITKLVQTIFAAQCSGVRLQQLK